MFKRLKKVKRKALIMLILILAFFIFVLYLYNLDFGKNKEIQYGATFSHKYAKELGLDWQEAYVNVLDDLRIKKLRLMAYWDELEMAQGQYTYQELDWLLAMAEQRQVEVILVIGRRQPRWPECHDPVWLDQSTTSEQQQAELVMIKSAIKHFQDFDNIIAWQVDNEPFLKVFGICPEFDKDFYQEKIALVQSLDERPIIITESGELSIWAGAAKISPIIGTSVYRSTWNPVYGKFFYPLPPAFYVIKEKLVKMISPLEEVFVSELQLEPWSDRSIVNIPIAEQLQLMSIEKFKDNLVYTRKIGFDSIYLWGVEWWYYLKVSHGITDYWDTAKELIKENS
ncbi:MAG: hypothetical protein AUJ28_03695 [Parcubacteria group bacterium CG1_02_37_51]|uniref:Glycoside hydrolase family 5 domain-containing protein n=3 Tax=Candidatus Komeiliibacteriota TaxID=1817908 RepID=A0A2M7REP7_9BACT|nr:MAG: hypothetical protein AUJ28_03695 [Parcubacteria group bacterium CG1_02_37_51]PIY95245.1 MAG: hypothetical protein COY67_00985 [Candidatus Komeilibacteria bacterium CG_4_10_14_0_8_um_filter_37_78]